MILISHRGNVFGKNSTKENSIQHIDDALSLGYNVEIDFWFNNESFYLGHDNPEYKIDLSWIEERKKKLWIHCKNMDSICFLNRTKSDLHYFWHEDDKVTLTSKGFIWAYPGNQPIQGSIAVMPEIYNDVIDSCVGICTDFVDVYSRR